MLGLMLLGIVLALMGQSNMSGFTQFLIDWTGNQFIFGGIVAAVVGGASMIFGGLVGKIAGVALLIVGIAVAVMGIVMKFILHLWFVHWLIGFGGMVMLVTGIIMAVIGLVGVMKGSDKDGTSSTAEVSTSTTSNTSFLNQTVSWPLL